MNKVKKDPVEAFLTKMKLLLKKDDGIVFVNNRGIRCLDYIMQLGLTIKDAKSEILTLKKTNLYKGPEKDRDREGVLWIFKKQ